MPKILPDSTHLVGNTPMVYLNKITKDCYGKIAVKVEFFNPSCSVKDRAGLRMIEAAEEKGVLIPGKSVLIECTSGNTGISMAQVGAVRGYRVILILPENASLERRAMMRSYGAELLVLDKTLHVEDGIRRAYELAKVIPNAVVLNQFINKDNPQVHFDTTGPEIWEQTDGKLAACVFGCGTGGTMTGVGRFLKSRNPSVKVFGVEPFEASILNGFPRNEEKHLIQGIGAGMIPDVLDVEMMDGCLRVKSMDAVEMALRLAKEEGFMVGISSGANVCAALQLASKEEYRDQLIVTSFADFGERYLSTVLYKDIFDEVAAQKPTTEEEDIQRFKALFQEK